MSAGAPTKAAVDPGQVMVHLRRCGVVVHHAARMPSPVNQSGERSAVVFLSKTLDQNVIARRCALRMPGVSRVTFAGFSATVMFVYGAIPRRP